MINGINGYARNTAINRASVAAQAEKATSSITSPRQKISIPRQDNGLKLLAGEDNYQQLARFALGMSGATKWEAKGLEISPETIDAAYETFQKAFSEGYKMSEGKAWSLSLNGHQIVIDNQDVPEWFLDDYQETLNAMEDNYVTEAFIAGELYVISPPGLSVKV